MAHPPIRESDITFEEWIHLVLNHVEKYPNQRIAVKLDFKDPPAVEPCLMILQDLHRRNKINIPIWVNADVYDAGNRVPPFDPDEFVSTVERILPGCVLSLGWTTTPTSKYEDKNVEEMLGLCSRHNLKNVTFPVRASLCRSSETQLRALLNHHPAYTLTIWSGAEKVSKSDLAWIKKEFEHSRIFLDVSVDE